MMSRRLAQALAATVLAVALYFSFLNSGASSNPARTVIFDKSVLEDSRAGNRTRFTFVDRGYSQHSQSLVFRGLVRAGTPGFHKDKSGSPPLHTHFEETECFRVLKGKWRYTLDGADSPIAHVPGDEPVCVPPGHAHTFWNDDSTQDLEVEITVSPHGKMLPFFQTYCGLAQDSKDGTLDSVNPLQLMLTIKAAGMSMDVMPKPVWWVLSHVLLPLSEYVYQPFYPEYTGSLS